MSPTSSPLKTLALPLALLATSPALCGFVLLSSRVATLPATPASPTITFEWDGKSPPITGKDTFADGQFQNLDDAGFMEALMNQSMGIWNGVPGSFVRLAVTQNANATIDATDKINSIVVQASSNLTTAAYAAPQEVFPDGNSGTIDDCDIDIADTSVDASGLAYTFAHELGHCLGLGHDHTNYNAIMGYARSDQQLKLGNDDKAGIIFLYPDPAYYDGKVHDLVCGVVGGRASSASLLLLLLVPLLPVGLRARAAPAEAPQDSASRLGRMRQRRR